MEDSNLEKVTYIGETDSRNRRKVFGIKAKDRSRHMYVIGKTGMGKSTLLENMAVQDIRNGEGMAFIDPHGKSADLLLDYVPKERVQDVIYFAPFDVDHPMAFNVMEDVGYDKRHLVMSGLMSAFKKIWVDAWSARMEYILGNTLLALLEYPGSTLLSINRMFSDKEYRKKVVENVTDTTVKAFWEEEFARYTDRFAAEATPAIQNKVGQFTSNPIIRNIIGQPGSSFDLRKIIDEKKIFIVNLSKGRIGEINANLLGSMLITKLYLSAMSRADVPESELKKLPNFFLYVDEFQSFANESFADILSEARKYKLNLTLAHQYIEQMAEEVKEAVFGNVGTLASFRVGAYDAEVLEKEFAPKFVAEDLVNLGFAQIYLKLMIDGISSAPFSATTLPPIEPPEISLRDRIIRHSREQYTYPREEVEDHIRNWYGGHKTVTEEKKTDHDVAKSGEPKRSKPQNKKKKNDLSKASDRPAPPKEEEETEDVGEAIRKAVANKSKYLKKKSIGDGEESKQKLRETLASLAQQKVSMGADPQDKNEDKGSETHSDNKGEENSEQDEKQKKGSGSGSSDERREVPESELKKILDIEDDNKGDQEHSPEKEN
ncbi:MAG: type IV secretion system DNA-binding domain-containing protein [Candidatus Paceibacterota bacterium]